MGCAISEAGKLPLIDLPWTSNLGAWPCRRALLPEFAQPRLPDGCQDAAGQLPLTTLSRFRNLSRAIGWSSLEHLSGERARPGRRQALLTLPLARGLASQDYPWPSADLMMGQTGRVAIPKRREPSEALSFALLKVDGGHPSCVGSIDNDAAGQAHEPYLENDQDARSADGLG